MKKLIVAYMFLIAALSEAEAITIPEDHFDIYLWAVCEETLQSQRGEACAQAGKAYREKYVKGTNQEMIDMMKALYYYRGYIKRGKELREGSI